MTHAKTSTLAFIVLQTCFQNFQLTQKSREATAPLAPLLPTPMLYYLDCCSWCSGTIAKNQEGKTGMVPSNFLEPLEEGQ